MTLRVLHIDDDHLICKALKRSITRLGHEIVSVTNPADYEKEIAKGEFDVVISDYNLESESTGIDMLEMARTIQPKALRILLTGNQKPVDFEESRQQIYILKTVEAETLRAYLDTWRKTA